MMCMYLITGSLIFLFFFNNRILYLTYKIIRRKRFRNIKKKSNPDKPVKTMICIGSGGHTTEMMKLVEHLNPKTYNPRVYVMASTDLTSKTKIVSTEFKFNVSDDHDYKIVRIPRSRRVHQSYISSIFTTLIAIFASIPVVITNKPDLILCNGPGTCVPICIIAFLSKAFFINRNVKIVFIESFCRVETISLTGKILGIFADEIIVQWKQLQKVCTRAECFGRLT